MRKCKMTKTCVSVQSRHLMFIDDKFISLENVESERARRRRGRKERHRSLLNREMSRFSHPHAPTPDALHMRRRVVLISWSLSHLPGIGDETSLLFFDSHNVRRASFVRRGVGTRVNQTMVSSTQYRCIKKRRRVDAISRDMNDDVSSTMIVHVLLNVLSIRGQARR